MELPECLGYGYGVDDAIRKLGIDGKPLCLSGSVKYQYRSLFRFGGGPREAIGDEA
jgi:hypothetical protein